MRTGNLTEPVLKRSVYRQLNMEISGTEGYYGADCVTVSESGCEADGSSGSSSEHSVCASCGPIPGCGTDPAQQVTAVANALFAGEACPWGLMIHGVLPADYEEASAQTDMKRTAAAAKQYGMRVLDVCVQVLDTVTAPQYIMTGFGKKEKSGGQSVLQPGQELIMTKWIGLAGTAALAEKYEQELSGRYPLTLIDRAKEFKKLVGVEEEARAISHFGSCAMHNLTQGGIFTALWEMAERAEVGLEVDLKKIPVKQETIEICEYFDINPYYFYSGGALLVGTDRAEALISLLAQHGISAAVIGRVTDGRERVILNGEDRRYLDRPQQEEWYRKLEETK